jgi:hypothetical protein
MPHGLTLCVDFTPRHVSSTGQVTEGHGCGTMPLHYLLHLDWDPERLRQHGSELIRHLPRTRKASLSCWQSAATQVGINLADTRPDSFRPLDIDIDRSAEIPGNQRMCARYLLSALIAADPAQVNIKAPGIAMAQVGRTADGLLVMQFLRRQLPRPTRPLTGMKIDGRQR